MAPNDPTSGDPQQTDSLVERLAEEFLSKLRDGQAPDLDEIAAEYAHVGDELRDVLSALMMLENAATDGDALPPSVASSFVSPPEQLGDYRIIRELGRGGMGVVYEAEHDTMRRRVALKVLFQPAKGGDEKTLDRFHREARAAGRLHHTNIVPVFEVGSHDGHHFYSMQRIRGQNLDIVIRDLRKLQQLSDSALRTAEQNIPSPTLALHSGNYEIAEFRESSATGKSGSSTKIVVPASSEVARVGQTGESYFHRTARIALQAANALAYAHEHGVLHRDIKPSNLILDTEGTVWVADFGLARSEGDALTLTGDIVGTLRYMAPERFEGEADARSDVYSLGLTLYELATLEPAFHGEDAPDLVRHVMQGTAPKPRKRNAEIPRDLETIILKAIARDPQGRYAAAEQMAEDLRLFLTDRPIQARRSSLTEQVFRWCRRNPSIAALLATVAMLLLVVVVGSLAFAFRTRWYAIKLEDEHRRAVQASRAEAVAYADARKSLYRASFREAQSERRNRLLDNREQMLGALRQAAELLPTLGLDEEELQQERFELRNELIEGLVLSGVAVDETVAENEMSHKAAAYDANFERYVVSRGDIEIRSTTDGTLLEKISQSQFRATDAEFSDDGVWLGTIHRQGRDSPRSIRIWNLPNKQTLFEDQCLVSKFCFSPADAGGNVVRVAYSHDRRSVTVRSLDAADAPDSTLRKNMDWEVRGIQFSPDGQTLAIVGDSEEVVLWDLKADEESSIPLRSRAASVAWSLRTNALAIGMQGGPILLWDMDSPKKEPREFRGHTNLVHTVQLTQRGNLIASTAWDGTTRLWDVASRREVQRIKRETFHGQFSKDGSRFYCRDVDDQTIVYRIQRSGIRTPLFNDRDLPRRNEVAAHPQRHDLVAVATSFHVELWDLKSETIIDLLETERTLGLKFSADGSKLLTSGRRGTRLWDIVLPNGPLTDPTSPPIAQSPRFLIDGNTYRVDASSDLLQVAHVTEDESLVIYPLRSPESASKLASLRDVYDVSVSPNGRWATVQSNATRGLAVLDAKSGEVVRTLTSENGAHVTAFSPDGKRLFGSNSRRRFLWETGAWQLLAESATPVRLIGVAAFSPNGRWLAASHDRYTLDLMNPQTLEVICRLGTRDDRRIDHISFGALGPDGCRLFVAVGTHFESWDLPLLDRELEKFNLGFPAFSPQ